VNDYMAFPMLLDMSKLFQRSGDGTQRPESESTSYERKSEEQSKAFELTGVIVHSGNVASSGHYHALLRHADRDGSTTWQKFKDDTVTPVSASDIAEQAFGGAVYDKTRQVMVEKPGSAYLIAYRRVVANTGSVGKRRRDPERSSALLPVVVDETPSQQLAADSSEKGH